jgi:hypothetical protein
MRRSRFSDEAIIGIPKEHAAGCCQTNANSSPFALPTQAVRPPRGRATR